MKDIEQDSFVNPVPVSKINHRRNSNYYKCFQNNYHAHKLLNANPSYITPALSTVKHWQLRDLIQVNNSKGYVHYTNNKSIKSINLQEISSPVKDWNLNYTPCCYSYTKDGSMITGGLMSPMVSGGGGGGGVTPDIKNITPSHSNRSSKGLFSFHNNETNESFDYILGELINNSVNIYPKLSNQYNAYVCNNDSYLYTLDINNEVKVANQIKCQEGTALNNICQSNKNLLTITGDSGSIFLIDSRDNSKINTIETNHDSGFGISYHSNDHIFSTAFQDGTCLLYDIRNLKKSLFEIKSTRPGHQSGAFRVCKFSNSKFGGYNNDLLVILEHVGRIHLIDLRNLNQINNHQVIVLPFALDQFSNYKLERINRIEKIYNENHNESNHNDLSIYNEDEIEFTAPLVYDYDYLTNHNSKLFKNYTYQPPPPPSLKVPSYVPPPQFNIPQWSENDSNSNCNINSNVSPTSSARPSLHYDPNTGVSNNDFNDFVPPNSSTVSDHTSVDSSSMLSFYDAYQQSVNHIHGELNLSGVDWFNDHLLIGCDGGGLVKWNINSTARRSFDLASVV